ncbi:isopeptide-forming domain-containing fimbrial protein [[Clostridium] innocuum]|nr:isopeptide-forming domain-containing fimbrial protein [[Clostridium] innocuum]
MKKEKILSFIVSFCMILTMLIFSGIEAIAVGSLNPSFSQSFTVTNLTEGTHVEVLKTVDLNLDSDGNFNMPVLTWNDSVKNWVSDKFPQYIDKSTKEVTDTFQKLGSNSAEANTFWQKMTAAYYQGKINFADKKDATADGNKNVTINGNGWGGYLVLAENPNNTGIMYKATSVNVLPAKQKDGSYENPKESITLVMKQDKEPGFEKEIPDISEITTGIGKIVNYRLNAQIPVYPADSIYKIFEISDQGGKGLKLVPDSIVVSLHADGSDSMSKITDYTLTKTENAFKIVVKESFLENHQGEVVYVLYQERITEEALELDEIENTTSLKYNPNPYKNDTYEIESKKKTYTYEINFDKKDENGTTYLTGAVFQLQDADGDVLQFVQDTNDLHHYIFYGSADAFDTAVTPVSDIEISKESSIQIDGLDTGTYRLIETKAPEGYVKPTGYIEITLEDTIDENSKNVPDGKLDKIEITNNGTYEIINNATTGSGSFSFIVKNRTPEDFNLPVTGGTGTLMFTLGGIVVMGGAVLLYARNRKCRSNAK